MQICYLYHIKHKENSFFFSYTVTKKFVEMHLLLVFVAIFAITQATVENDPTTLWNSFKSLHNKQYSSAKEEAYRYEMK